MPASQGEFCGNCRFAVQSSSVESSDIFSCARFPPVPYLETLKSAVDGSDEQMIRAMFPVMRSKGWCGEWQTMGAKN